MKKLQAIPMLAIAAAFLVSGASHDALSFPREGKAYIDVQAGPSFHDLKRTITGAATANLKSMHTDMAVGGSLGYHLLDELRVAITPMYVGSLGKGSKKSATATSGTLTSRTSIKKAAVFADVAFDMLTGTPINPYITGGIGMVRYQFRDTLTLGSTTDTLKKSKSKLAYKIGAGLAYHFNTSMDFELGYTLVINRVGSNKNKKFVNYTSSSLGVNVAVDPGYSQMTTIGIRYTF